MSVSDEHERAIEFARGALARARAHTRTAHRSGWRPSRARGASQRWGVQAGEAVYSGATADRRDPAPLGAALSELISLQGWSEALTVAGVTSRWADIVGADVAEHVCVEAFEVGDSANSAVRPGKSDVGDVSGTALESLPSGTDTRTSNSHSTPNESVTADAAPEGASKSTGVPSGNLARIVVRADSTAWATQLRLLLPALRRRIADDLGVLADRSGFGSRGTWQVEVTVLAPSAPSWRKGPRHVSGRGPRDTYG